MSWLREMITARAEYLDEYYGMPPRERLKHSRELLEKGHRTALSQAADDGHDSVQRSDLIPEDKVEEAATAAKLYHQRILTVQKEKGAIGPDDEIAALCFVADQLHL